MSGHPVLQHHHSVGRVVATTRNNRVFFLVHLSEDLEQWFVLGNFAAKVSKTNESRLIGNIAFRAPFIYPPHPTRPFLIIDN